MAKVSCAFVLALSACSAPPSTPRAPAAETTPAPDAAASTPDVAPDAAVASGCTDVNDPACQAVMACPDPPDRRVRACKPDRFPRPCPKYGDLSEPDCPPIEAAGRVIKVDTASSGEVFVTISAGSEAGVHKTWTATLLRGDSGEALLGGEITLVRIDKHRAVGKVKVSVDDVRANTHVRLAAP